MYSILKMNMPILLQMAQVFQWARGWNIQLLLPGGQRSRSQGTEVRSGDLWSNRFSSSLFFCFGHMQCGTQTSKLATHQLCV